MANNQKELLAIARANEVFDALTRMQLLRSQLITIMEHHAPQHGDRRDVAAFNRRLDELNLRWLLARELTFPVVEDWNN